MFSQGILSKLSVEISDEDDSPRLSPSRKALTDKTIVLDMDLTLLCTIGDGSDLSQRMRSSHRETYDVLVKKGVIVPTTLTQFGGSGTASHNDVVKRPGVDELLTFCRAVFKNVILWSAGQANYVYDTVKLVLDPHGRGIFDHVFTAHDVSRHVVDLDNRYVRSAGPTIFTTKPLKKITELFPDATLEKTVIVDDLQCNFIPNPRNGILIPPFSPQLSQLLNYAQAGPLDNISGDYSLFSLIHFFADDEFIEIKDVRDYDLRFFD